MTHLCSDQLYFVFLSGVAFIPKKKNWKLCETFERLLHLAQHFYNYCEKELGIMKFLSFLG